MKVLIVTYYWPPAGGPGVQRWLKFVKYLRDFGIEPVLFTPENPTYPMTDASLLEEVPSDVTIIQKKIFEPYALASLFSKKEAKTISKGIIATKERQSFLQKILLFIRGNFFIPDARKFWVKPSVNFLKKYLKEEEIQTIITTGPPHSVHLIGKALQEKLAVNWIADFRDPWTTIGYHDKLKLTKRAQRKHKRLEKQVLTSADHIVVTSFTTKKEFDGITNRPISVITNGYDKEEIVQVHLSRKFTISHIGSLLSGRNPKVLWEALYELTQEIEEFANRFELQLVGAVSEDVLSSIREEGLDAFLVLQGYVSHQEAIQFQRSSQVLLLIEIDSPETRCIIPGKLFEYMISNRPIIAIGPQGADVAQILHETKAGNYFHYDQKERLKKQMLDHFERYKTGTLVNEVKGIDQYSRKSLTSKLADLIKELN